MLDATTGEVGPISCTMHPALAPPSHPLSMATSVDATVRIVDLVWDAPVLNVDTIINATVPIVDATVDVPRWGSTPP